METNPTDTFRLWSDCGRCHKEGPFRRKHEHIMPNGVKIYSRSFMCKSCLQIVEKMLVQSENLPVE